MSRSSFVTQRWPRRRVKCKNMAKGLEGSGGLQRELQEVTEGLHCRRRGQQRPRAGCLSRSGPSKTAGKELWLRPRKTNTPLGSRTEFLFQCIGFEILSWLSAVPSDALIRSYKQMLGARQWELEILTQLWLSNICEPLGRPIVLNPSRT